MSKATRNWRIVTAMNRNLDEKKIGNAYLYEISFLDNPIRSKHAKVNSINVGCLEIHPDDKNIWYITIRDFQLELEKTIRIQDV